MATTVTGGCVCGAVRYECDWSPLRMFNCHCRTCQLAGGGPYLPLVIVRASAFRLTKGALRYHVTDRITGALHKRGFCADCGTHITGGETPDHPTRWLGFPAVTLDDPSVYKPEADIFVSHAQVWDRLDPALPKHETYPPRREDKGARAG